MIRREAFHRVAGPALGLAIAGLAVAAAAAEPATAPAADDGPVVAVVNGEPILLADVEAELGSLHGSVESGQRADFDLDRLMFRLVNDTLLGQEARSLGLDKEAPIPRKVAEYRESLALRRLEKEEVSGRAEPTTEEVQEAFQEQYRRVTFRVVTAYERAGAEEMLAALEGGADMAQLARERSVDPYRARGGLVDDLPRADLQFAIAEVVFNLEPGRLAGPIATDLGWSVLRVDRFAAADPARFAGLESGLRRLVRQRKSGELRAALAQKLRAKFPVRVDEAALAAVRPQRSPDGRLVPVTPDPDAIVVRVGEAQEVTARQYSAALLERWKRVRNETAASASAPIILQGLIEDRLLRSEAVARGYGSLPEVDKAVRAFETQLLIPRILGDLVSPGVKVSEEEKRAYYASHKSDFRRPPRLRLAQITVRSEEEAERLAAQLRDGADVAWLARQHSVDRFKEAGGDRGWSEAKVGNDPFEQKLLSAAPGTVLDPFGELDNWVVLKVTGREEQGVYPYEEVSGNVREAVFRDKLNAAVSSFMDKLRERSEIEVHEDVLAGLRIRGTVEEKKPGAHGVDDPGR